MDNDSNRNSMLNTGRYCYRIGGLVGENFDCRRAKTDDPEGLCRMCQADRKNLTVLDQTLVYRLIKKVRSL